ncbi:MAG: hypothetical protein K0M45_10610 [Candidatus Paracaedibacteraceae bacterium]|nr:hypothetical protein [Candidatus Paracaedibacteraceae bacterium]
MIRLVSIFTLYVSLIANNLVVEAADLNLLEEREGMIHPVLAKWECVPSISEMTAQIYNFLQSGRAPEEISVVLDVDGTLTNQADPTSIKPEDIVVERGAAVKFVQWLIRQKINVVFASAWHKIIEGDPLAGFRETLGRLEKLGFKDLLAEGATVRGEEWEEKSLSVMASGHAVSVKDRAATAVPGSFRKDIYYRQKAYALWCFDKNIADKTKAIFFADDSRGNTERFKSDILDAWPSLYPNLQEIYIYTLTERLTEVNSWHQVFNLIQEIGEGEVIDPFSVSLSIEEESLMMEKETNCYQEDPYSPSSQIDYSSSLWNSMGSLRSSAEDKVPQTLSPRRVLISSQ